MSNISDSMALRWYMPCALFALLTQKVGSEVIVQQGNNLAVERTSAKYEL